MVVHLFVERLRAEGQGFGASGLVIAFPEAVSGGVDRRNACHDELVPGKGIIIEFLHQILMEIEIVELIP